jgi:4-phytase/acid phosphatase
MSVRVFAAVLVAALLAGIAPASAQLQPTPPGWQIERAVVLSRHGVRAPTRPNAELDKTAATAWPTWPVAPGFLTPHGEELMRLMGTYYRVLYGGRGLVQADNCPAPGTVAAWTDIDQRTRASGAAILAGMYPRCANLPLRNQADFTVPDPLFRPQPTAACPMDAAATRAAILARVGGSFASIHRDYAPQLSMMRSVLCPGDTTATAAPAGPGGGRCGDAGMASHVETNARGSVWLSGPLGLASTAAEAFLMQSAEGMPKDQVAWGRLAHPAALEELMSLHILATDLTAKTKAIARQQGSNMLAQIVAVLKNGHNFPGAAPTGQPVRLGLIVGHQTNIYNLAGLLDLSWRIPGFLAGEASPGGALAFEQFRDVASGRRYVRIAYYGQTLEEMRTMARLDYRDPPGMVAVPLPACQAQSVNDACPLEAFEAIAAAAIEPKCVTVSTGAF